MIEFGTYDQWEDTFTQFFKEKIIEEHSSPENVLGEIQFSKDNLDFSENGKTPRSVKLGASSDSEIKDYTKRETKTDMKKSAQMQVTAIFIIILIIFFIFYFLFFANVLTFVEFFEENKNFK